MNPDEVLHLQIANSASLLETYRFSLTNAHPPLFMLLLHVWKEIVGTGWQLCLPSVAFGSAFLWAAYRWSLSLFGTAAALLILSLLAFLPSLVLLSVELRGYALLLCLMAAALAALERALKERSPRWLAISAALSGLSLLTHYSALRFALAASVYTAVRVGVERAPGKFVRAWVVSQGAVAAVFLWLYASHISTLRGSALEREAQGWWLQAAYFRAGQESPLQFLWRQTASLFRYLFSSPVSGMVALVLVLAGIAWLAGKRQPATFLVALPLAFGALGGLLRLYPYGGTRHSIDLVLFSCAAIGVSLSRFTAERVWVAIALAVALAPAAFAAGW